MEARITGTGYGRRLSCRRGFQKRKLVMKRMFTLTSPRKPYDVTLLVRSSSCWHLDVWYRCPTKGRSASLMPVPSSSTHIQNLEMSTRTVIVRAAASIALATSSSTAWAKFGTLIPLRMAETAVCGSLAMVAIGSGRRIKVYCSEELPVQHNSHN